MTLAVLRMDRSDQCQNVITSGSLARQENSITLGFTELSLVLLDGVFIFQSMFTFCWGIALLVNQGGPPQPLVPQFRHATPWL